MRNSNEKSENQKMTNGEKMEVLQNEYKRKRMTEEQLRRLRVRMCEAKVENLKDRRKIYVLRCLVTAAVLVMTFVSLPNMSPSIAYAMERIPFVGSLVRIVTFRDYVYEDEQYKADVRIPELTADAKEGEGQSGGTLSETTDEINTEIQKITNALLTEFTERMRKKNGYMELIVKSEVLVTAPEYFTLKLSCYQNEASGYEENYYYTIDLTSGERMQLKDFFVEGADYITPISENIKAQMRERMDADKNVSYWLNDEMEEINFESIAEENPFYINEKNHLVISFNEGEVAPMYMGVVTFEIPDEVLAAIRK